MDGDSDDLSTCKAVQTAGERQVNKRLSAAPARSRISGAVGAKANAMFAESHCAADESHKRRVNLEVGLLLWTIGSPAIWTWPAPVSNHRASLKIILALTESGPEVGARPIILHSTRHTHRPVADG